MVETIVVKTKSKIINVLRLGNRNAFNINRVKHLPIKQLLACGVVLLATVLSLGQFLPHETNAADSVNGGIVVTDVTAGGDHTCAIFTTPAGEGQLYCWGKNDKGQLGIGNFVDQLSPVSVMKQFSADSKVKQVSAGLMHTCAVVESSASTEVYCWGKNDNGQLGNGITLPVTVADSQNSNVPVIVTGPSGASAMKVSAGFAHTCAVYDNNNLWQAYCWGNNDEGQLGDRSGVLNTITGEWTTKPTSVSNPVLVNYIDGITDISVGATHSCAAADGFVACWGGNGNSQFGDNTTMPSSGPQLISTSNDIRRVSSGFFNNCGIFVDNNTYCWGDNTSGQIGNNTNTVAGTPVQVGGLLNGKITTDLSAGYAHVCAVADDKLYCWGENSSGQLLDGDAMYANKLVPTAVNTSNVDSIFTSNMPVVKKVAGGFAHTCAIYGESGDDSNNVLFCGGLNDDGELGVGDTVQSSLMKPVGIGDILSISAISPDHGPIAGGTVVTITGSGFDDIATVLFDGLVCGSISLDSNTSLMCSVPAHSYGSVDVTVVNTLGQTAVLHDGYEYMSLIPKITSIDPEYGPTAGGTEVTITGENFIREMGFTEVAAGDRHSMAIDSDGNLYTWGRNNSGQIGNGTATGNVTSPWQVNGGSGSGIPASTKFRAISAGDRHSMAIDSDGNLYTWGYNGGGQLGTGGYADSSVPINISTTNALLTGKRVNSVSAGSYFSTAIDSDGHIWTWGDGDDGQLGNGNFNRYPNPGDVTPLVSALSNLTLGGVGYECINLTVLSDTTATCTTPTHSAEVVDVIVAAKDGQTAVLPNGYTYEDDYINISTSGGGGVNLAINPAPNGVVSSNSQTVSFTTNYDKGIVLKLSTNVDHNNLSYINGGSNTGVINPVIGSLASPSVLSNNSWGFKLGDGSYVPELNNSSSTSTWSTVPNKNNPLTIKTTTQANRDIPNTTDVFYGAKANTSLQAGTYQTTILYTGVANP